MSVDHIRYDLLAQDALRSVVRRVLTDAAKSGLPGEHHFYISFDTRAPGVRLSQRLRAQYPETMTVVLQHQFWDLTVTDQSFEVGLSFGGVSERLLVPFEAIKGFFDPSVQFGLQFETASPAVEDAPTAAPLPAPAETPRAKRPARAKPAAREDGRERPVDAATTPADTVARDTPASRSKPRAEAADEPDPAGPPGSGEVVRLDRFRKK
jgi:uncharacterized protein